MINILLYHLSSLILPSFISPFTIGFGAFYVLLIIISPAVNSSWVRKDSYIYSYYSSYGFISIKVKVILSGCLYVGF